MSKIESLKKIDDNIKHFMNIAKIKLSKNNEDAILGILNMITIILLSENKVESKNIITILEKAISECDNVFKKSNIEQDKIDEYSAIVNRFD